MTKLTEQAKFVRRLAAAKLDLSSALVSTLLILILT